MGIEPTQPAWKAGALPLSYTRRNQFSEPYNRFAFTPAAFSSTSSRHDVALKGAGGGGWIRTNVGVANGFTARPL